MWDQTQVIRELQNILSALNGISSKLDSLSTMLSGDLAKIFVVLFCFVLLFIFVKLITPRWI